MKLGKFLSKFDKQGVISQTVILAMIFGFAAGLVGQIFADVYINPWQQDFGTLSPADIQNTGQIVPELKKIKKFLGIQQDFEVNNSVNKVYPALIGIYAKKTAGADTLKKIYLPQELIGTGSILTSDGWLFTANIPALAKKDQLTAVYAGKAYEVTSLIVDSATNIAFAKINAGNLPVIAMGDSEEITAGQLALILNFSGETLVANVKNNRFYNLNKESDLILSSEKNSRQIQLAEVYKPAFLGGPLVNLAGEVVGVITDQVSPSNTLTAVPINSFRYIITDILRNGTIKRPRLGVNYLDLSSAWGFDSALAQNQTKGALIWQPPRPGTPAFSAGLKLHDIILAVDGQQVDEESLLADLIGAYKPDSEVELEIMRDGKTQKLKVKLDTMQK